MKFFNFNLYVNKRKILSTGLAAFIIGVMLGGILWNFSYMPTFTPEPQGPLSPPMPSARTQTYLKRFSSYEELKNFVNASSQVYPYYESWRWGTTFAPTPTALNIEIDAASVSYSTTNIQVEGVDEADIIKTDGEYIYVVSGKRIIILQAYPPEKARVLSQISLNGTLMGIFINGDKLAAFEEEGFSPYVHVGFLPYEPFILYGTFRTFIKVYDISNRESPVLTKNVFLNGSYFSSRMIGDYVYTVINQPAYYYEDEVPLPKIYSDDGVEEINATDIYYANISDYSYMFTTIVAINVQNDWQKPTHKTFLFGATSCMYVSLSNIYITLPRWDYIASVGEKTLIYRIHVENDEIVCEASGNVSGTVLNQFSMDEYNGYFRIATTKGDMWSGTSRNNVYVLDMNLTIVGKLEDLAPGERIYSARFMGDRCYLVTFRKVDPLFVIDLTNSSNPEVLGYLKITGYSDYLHPYDENHIIGIGKETIAAEEGDFSWYQGVKISLFDVSDVNNPKQIANYTIGDRGTDSPILRDHKAFLFDKSKNLLVIPVLVAEINETKYPDGVPPYVCGEYVWQGAYVFHISLDEGLAFRGGITHLENDTDLMKSGYYFSSPYYVKRSLYIDNVLYTISDKKIKMNDLENLHEIKEVEFPT